MRYAPVLKQACSQLDEPVSLSAYYKYRQLYRRYAGDRSGIATALRRKTYNQSQMSPQQLHFIDTLILRFYAGQRTARLRPKTLYKLAKSTLARTGNLWLDPDKCSSDAAENVVEELLNPHLPMQAILNNPEKAGWLTKINLPSQSWFYTYLRWFESQSDQGQKVITARYGAEMWEREYMVFDTFVHRAVRPLEYVFADHWLVDVFTVDEATRQRLNRLWLTLLIDAYSRCVLGLALLYETPCIISIQSALRHAIWPKVSHQALGIKEEWVCYGIPQQLSLDNAWAHHAHSLEYLARAISQGGRYNSIDLVFRPPYRGRYGALIERLFGNFSGQFKELLTSAISASSIKGVQNAARRACLLYQDIYAIIHQLIVRYQHTPHWELDGLTPHQKWLEGWQLGYGGWPPPLTEEIERLFWRRSPETRVISSKGICAFGMHYWSPALDQAQRKGLDGQSVRYSFSYEPADISRLALFRDQHWLGDVYAKELRRADGSYRSISLWERRMARDLARNQGQVNQDWLRFVTGLNDLEQKRLAEKKQAVRRKKVLPETGVTEQIDFEQDYTELLLSFGSQKEVENVHQEQ
jgi:transposase InsO family protein